MTGKLSLLILALALAVFPSFHSGLFAQGSAHGVTLIWTAGTNDVTYNVYRSITSGGPYTQIATNVSALTYFDSTGTQGTKYFYVVTGAAPGFLESSFSNEVSATFLSQAGAPGSLGATVK